MGEIALIGIGMGNREGVTVEAWNFIASSDLLIGAGRMLENFASPGQRTLAEYLPEKVAMAIEKEATDARIAILMSGDIGFYSGARRLLEVLPEGVRIMPGISSLVCFASRLGLSWEDVKITSQHGRRSNLIGLIDQNKKVFSLLGSNDGVQKLARKLADFGMAGVTIHVGQNLGYENERIDHGHPDDFLSYQHDKLAVLMVENPDAKGPMTHSIPDEDFLRDRVPMTKEEVRTISISKLALKEDSIVYDVGAGSGSISVEAALTSVNGKVYAIEKNPDAVKLLKANALRFHVDNMEIVEGYAPEALEELESPTHVFIGGSSGNMKEILALVLSKNRQVSVVINAITLETVAQALASLKELPFADPEVVSITASKARKVGGYNMMMGQNPVYIITSKGLGSAEKEEET